VQSLALKSDGTVVAWGSGPEASVPEGLSNVTAISAGYSHNLALRSDRTVVAWGDHWFDYGQFAVPAGLSNVIAVSAGAYHSLALKSDGTVVAWGWNIYGQAKAPIGLSNVVAIAAGGLHNLALKSDGTVAAWGFNLDNVRNYSGQATVPAGLSNVVAVAAGGYHSLALKSDGTVAAWGTYEDDGHAPTPAVPATGLTNVLAIAGGPACSITIVAPSPTACSLSCSTNITVCSNSGQCGALVEFAPPVGTDCGGLALACFPPSGSFFPVGTNTVICGVLDAGAFLTNTCSFKITVQDCEPPVIHSIVATPGVLWPPNHKMETVNLRVLAKDNCHLVGSRIISVSSNPPASGGTDADWQIAGDLSVRLRAERSGNAARVYIIVVQSVDDSENTTTATLQVPVTASH